MFPPKQSAQVGFLPFVEAERLYWRWAIADDASVPCQQLILIWVIVLSQGPIVVCVHIWTVHNCRSGEYLSLGENAVGATERDPKEHGFNDRAIQGRVSAWLIACIKDSLGAVGHSH